MDEFINKIINDDCLNVIKKLPDNSIDAVITSPPYNLNIEYDKYKDDKSFDEYIIFMKNVLSEIKRIVKIGGRVMINLAPANSLYYPTHHILSAVMIELGFIWKAEFIWNKNNYSCPYTTWGSWKSPSSPYIKTTYEYINIYCKDSLKKTGKQEDIDITEEEFKKWTNGLWNITPEINMKKFGHPAMFPEEIPKRLIKLFTYKNDIILDPFCGTGTTCLVAKKLARKFIGIDISEQYCKVAEKRIKNSFLDVNIFDFENINNANEIKI